MANWRSRQRTKKSSQTPGKTKGDTCQTNPIKKFFASSPKAYKHLDYDRWHEKFKKAAIGGNK